MKIGVIGLGRIGLVCALGLKRLGHTVFGYDTNQALCEKLENLCTPFFEPGLEDELLKHPNEFKLLQKIGDLQDLQLDQIWICVPTPTTETGQDLSAIHDIFSALQSLNLSSMTTLVLRSTILPKTSEQLAILYNIDFVYHPEFLAEGQALSGFTHPHRIVLGVNTSEKKSTLALEQFRQIYAHTNCEWIVADYTTVEISKYAANVMLASRLATLNEIQKVSTLHGGDQALVEQVLSLDPRIGSLYLKSGNGIGGPCLRKDTAAFAQHLRSSFEETEFTNLSSLLSSDDGHRKFQSEQLNALIRRLQPDAIVFDGVSFKEQTDDLTCSSQIHLLGELIKEKPNAKIFIKDERISIDSLRVKLLERLEQTDCPALGDFNTIPVLPTAADFNTIPDLPTPTDFNTVPDLPTLHDFHTFDFRSSPLKVVWVTRHTLSARTKTEIQSQFFSPHTSLHFFPF